MPRKLYVYSFYFPHVFATASGLLVGQAWALRRLARRFVFAAKHYQSVVLKPTVGEG